MHGRHHSIKMAKAEYRSPHYCIDIKYGYGTTPLSLTRRFRARKI